MRYFVTFKPTSSLQHKVMVFTNIPHQIVWDNLVKLYGNSFLHIYSEQDFATQMPQLYENQTQWVLYGEECIYVDNGVETVYPNEFKRLHSVSVKSITDWFKAAKPTPTNKDTSTQLGAMYEEVTESVSSLLDGAVTEGWDKTQPDLYSKLVEAKIVLGELSQYLYKSEGITLSKTSQIDMLDALADITVTTTGSAYMLDIDFDGALTEVNRSNFSKFENGKPVFNEDGKIIKGKDYFKPDLTGFISKK